MDWHALWQGLLSRALWEIITLLGGGTVFGLLKAKRPKYAPIFLYAFAGAACIALLLFTMTGQPILSRALPETAPDNVEGNVRSWIDDFRLNVQKLDEAQTFFTYAITLKNGTLVFVRRYRDARGQHYITFQAGVHLSTEHQSILATFTPEEAQRVSEEVLLEAARSRVGYELEGPPLRGVNIVKAVPITANLTEDSFSGYLDEMDSALSACKAAIILAISRTR